MAYQYFDNNPDLKSEEKKIKFYIKGKEISLYSDNGVFSKGGIDLGSNILLKNTKIKEDATVLDVGCGYGTIGISLAVLYPNCNVTMCDVNDRAIGLTKKAIEENNLKNATVLHSNTYENIDKKFDVIISNPPIRAGKQVVHDIVLNAYEHLLENGVLFFVIRKQQGAKSLFELCLNKYNTSEIIAKENDYWIIKCIK